jgi:hypothetical protein
MIIALGVELDDTAASVTPPNGTAPMLVKVQPAPFGISPAWRD